MMIKEHSGESVVVMNVCDYLKRLKRKYDFIARQGQGKNPAEVDLHKTIGEQLNIKEGKVSKQLPKKLIKEDRKGYVNPHWMLKGKRGNR